MEHNMTGYPSIDKPWEKHYCGIDTDKFKNKTVYQSLRNNNAHSQHRLALEYFGFKANYKTFFQKIEETAKAYYAIGVREGDYVTICAAGIPETVYSFYALSKIGAVANMMSPYFNHDQLIKRVEDCQSDIFVVMDTFYDGLKSTISKSRIKKVIVVPSLNSSPLRFVTKKYKLGKDAPEIFWNKFIQEGTCIADAPVCAYRKEQPVAMVYSSGTTGASKGILLTNDSFQNSVTAYWKTGVDLSAGQKFYQIIPPWFSTGLSTSIHLPLVNGISVFMDPRFERKYFVRNIVRAKPNYTVATTSMYEGFLDEKLVGNKDLSFFNYPFEGGEPLSCEVRRAIETVFRNHGNNSSLKVGYGQCECGATATTEMHNVEQPEGSVGIPIPSVIIGIFDENRNEEPYGHRGEVLINTPCRMKEYYKNPDATNHYFYIDKKGTKWNCTGDIGYIDSDGYLYIEGRANDFCMVGDKKVYNFDVEKVVTVFDEVKLCDVLEKRNELSENKIAVHIVLTDTFKKQVEANHQLVNDLIVNIQKRIFETVGDIALVPHLFKIRESFPYAKSGKRDTLSMKLETDGFIRQSFEM